MIYMMKAKLRDILQSVANRGVEDAEGKDKSFDSETGPRRAR